MAKHRLEQPAVGQKAAKSALVAGSIAIGGSLAFAAAPADAAPVTIPNVGTFEIPGLPPNAVPKAPRAPRAHRST